MVGRLGVNFARFAPFEAMSFACLVSTPALSDA